MDRKFLKPFAISMATLLAGSQADASIGIKLAETVSDRNLAQASADGLTLAKPEAGVQMAQHQSHSSHSSHASHASHSSSSF
ncbi:hypothetical protein [Rhizorhabdus argentea]|uniref:hypothetical protein n=1 Tax=Rhizorhabdus argentea TaxID=1387174 RepID=UPI0030ECAA72